MKKSIVRAKGITGIYSDKSIEIEIGQTAKDCKVKINGKKLSNVHSAHIHMRAGEFTKLNLILFKEKNK